MLHVHDFLPAARVRVAERRVAPLTPAAYLRLRRAAAGVSIPQLAEAMIAYRRRRLGAKVAAHPAYATARDAVDLIELLERDGTRAMQRRTIEAVAACVPLDIDVYFQLADEPAGRHPRVCRGCGCSSHDACHHDSYGSCAWTSPTQCSHCAHLRGRA